MSEVLVKTHLIITDIHEEYHMNWCGRVLNTRPRLKNGKPIFSIVGTRGRIELNTTDMLQIEKIAKKVTQPKGKEAVTTDTARVYLQEENGNEVLMGILTHNHVKTFAPMFDKIDFI